MDHVQTGSVIQRNIQVKVAGFADVIVCGGGTAGCVAAIAAARNGAEVILLERNYFLGGMVSEGNAGLTKYVLHGKDTAIQSRIIERLRRNPSEVQCVGGIPLEITRRLMERGAAIGTGGQAGSYVYTDSQEFKILLHEMMQEAGVHVLLHHSLCDVLCEEGNLRGVITLTKGGYMAYYGDVFIDATGDGDVAALAGVPFILGVGPEDAVFQEGLSELGILQNMGAMFRIGGVDFDRYVEYLRKHSEAFVVQRFGQMSYEEFLEAHENGDMMIGAGLTPSGRRFQIYNYPRSNIMIGCVSVKGSRNGLDAEELTRAEYDVMIAAKKMVSELRESVPGFENTFVLDTPCAGIRESRHILGEYKLNIMDIQTQKDFEDTIGKGCHPVDIYPLPKEMEKLTQPDLFYFNIPYRCLVAHDIRNLLLAGRCISSTREAAGCTRPTMPCMVTGEAAGTAAAICSREMERPVHVKDIHVDLLRDQLRRQGARI